MAEISTSSRNNWSRGNQLEFLSRTRWRESAFGRRQDAFRVLDDGDGVRHAQTRKFDEHDFNYFV